MRILHLIYSEQVAGAEKYLLDLLPGLLKEGITCDLICITPKKDQSKFEWVQEELNHKGIKTTLMVAEKYNLLGAAYQVNRYIKQAGIQYIHSHLFKADLIAVILKKILNRKVHLISTRHGYQESYFKDYKAGDQKIPRNLYYYISKFILKHIDYHIAISRAMSDLYYRLKLTPRPMNYIHHGVNVITGNNNPSDFRKANPQLVIVGRIELIKGHSYLLKAMPVVIQKYPEARLLVIGNGREKDNLVRQAESDGITSHIDFLGFQKNPYDYIASSDVVILPSLFEPFGLVYVESFALKTPVVCFDVQACNEIITDGETGLLAQPLDYDQLAEKIIYLLDHPEERERISANAYRRYKEYFNTERMIKDTASWYRSFVPAG